jgi:hypothetical protein
MIFPVALIEAAPLLMMAAVSAAVLTAAVFHGIAYSQHHQYQDAKKNQCGRKVHT